MLINIAVLQNICKTVMLRRLKAEDVYNTCLIGFMAYPTNLRRSSNQCSASPT